MLINFSGKHSEKYPNLKKEDFIIIIQTEHQKMLASKFGNLGVCCDSTHGTNAYDFTLTTLLVVDEFGEGQPIGWCIANHEDYNFMKFFFSTLSQNNGKLSPA